MKIILNMIVRNESARIERCLNSVLPYISGAVIVDTGSTDDTINLIKATLSAADISCAVVSVPFVNFEQARNAALMEARVLWFGEDRYFLLVDADMELVVEDPTCFDNLTGASYDIIQKAGTLSYHNRRLVRADQTGQYRGVTHEFLDVASAGTVTGVHFLDHADGANRKDKFGRDIELLLADLRDNPANERSWFYLAQSYRDNGQPAEAAQAYRRRFEMGGWDEECWNARVNYAHCLNTMGDEGGFIRELLAAYNFRPSRAEALYDLAKHFREKGDNNTSLLFSEPGMAIPRTPDVLFVNDHVYEAGLKEEFSIAAFYNPTKRDRGFEVTNELMLSKTAWIGSRELAKQNSYHYIKPLSHWVPSFRATRIEFTPPDGYTAMNPSIVNHRGTLLVNLRTVNYTIDQHGRYLIRSTNGEANNSNPIDTRNFLMEYESVRTPQEILWVRPEAQFKPVTGLEDIRLFSDGVRLHFSACVREQNAEGWCEQFVGEIRQSDKVSWFVDNEHPMRPAHRQNEKNWMPFVVRDRLKFVYRLGTVISENYPKQVVEPRLYTDTISGGSQLVSFNLGRLAVVHEARYRPDGTRYYQHRFAKFNAEGDFEQLSMPFVLHDRQIEFVAGLCWRENGRQLLMSYGVRDEEAWIAEFDAAEVFRMFQ